MIRDSIIKHQNVFSHDVRCSGRPIQIDKGAFVAAFCTLYNCHIEEGAVVAVGSVVRSQTVKAYTIVAGNPARVIARWNGSHWDYAGGNQHAADEG